MITASHNPCEYNGIKIFQSTGYKLPDAIEEEIELSFLIMPSRLSLKSAARSGKRIYCKNCG
jgi:phosphoglucosamine mutase